jgi:hypothetical protein
VPTNAHNYIYILILKYYIANAATCFGASAPSSGSFDVEFAEVIKYYKFITLTYAISKLPEYGA